MKRRTFVSGVMSAGVLSTATTISAEIVVAVLSTPALMTPLTNVRLFIVMLPLRQWQVEN